MRIHEVRLIEVQMELRTPFAASSHHAQQLHHVLVRLESTDGVVGWGECATPTDPYYLGETTDTAWYVLHRFIVPAVLRGEFEDIESFASCYANVKGNTFARAGVEMAAWDLLGRASGRSIAQLIGGSRTEIVSGVSLGIERDIADLLARIEQHLEEGYRRVKLKVSPGKDIAILEAVRRRWPGLPLMVDANAAYALHDAEHLQRFDEFGLMMIEQPLGHDDFLDHAALQRRLATPICLDESIRCAAHARLAIELGSCRVLNIKVPRVGGLLEARRIHDVCVERGIPVWCGGMHDYGIGRAANIAVASLPGFSIPGDVSGSDKYFPEDIVDPPIRAHRGAIAVPSVAGLGYEPVPERIAKRTVRQLELRRQAV